jgi:hypothetical protein
MYAMKSNILKLILAAGAASSLLFTAVAQDVPEAFVDEDGNLVIGDQVIPPPEGTVDGDGNLVVEGVTIPKPTATLLEDGSLDLGEGNVLQVPELPVTLFFSDLFAYGESNPGWYYSDIINHFWDGAAVGTPGWIFWEDWGMIDQNNGWFFLNTKTGSEEGFWTYSNHFDSWCYFFVGGSGFSRLSGGADPQTGWFYVEDPLAGGNQWHFYDQYFAEWADGARVCLYSNDDGATWVRLR